MYRKRTLVSPIVTGLLARIAAVALVSTGGCRDSDSRGAAPSSDTAAVVSPGTANRTATPEPDTTPASGRWGAFAYADSSGTRLLALGPPVPDAVVEALCGSGARLPVRRLGHQPRTADDNGRQRAANFANDEGDVFGLVGGAARPDETCFLATPAMLALGPRPIENTVPGAADSACDPGDVARLTGARRRGAVRCARIASTDAGIHVLGVEFEPRGDSALASLVVTDPVAQAFLDFPATRGPEGDTWRVGDGGVFHPGAFQTLFLARGPSGTALAFTWAGEEGESLTLAVFGSHAGSADRRDSRVPVHGPGVRATMSPADAPQ